MKLLSRLGMLFFFSSAAAFAVTPYISAGAGYLLNRHDPLWSGRIGLELTTRNTLTHAVEAELIYTENTQYDLKTSVTGVLANYRLTADLNPNLYLTAGGGIGSANVRAKARWFATDDRTHVYQLFGGIGYRFTPQFSVEGNIRYLDVGHVSFFTPTDQIGNDTSIEVGVKFRF